MRARDWVPVPQEWEQEPQAAHSETTQSTGQALVLQSWVSSRLGQMAPPCSVAVIMGRVRVWVPQPQDLEQACQSFHWPTTQSMGQAWVLQRSSSSSSPGQATPPWAAATLTERVRILVPPLHDLVQSDQASQLVTTQSTGQA